MELQTYHSTINSANEYEPDVLNIFLCNTG